MQMEQWCVVAIVAALILAIAWAALAAGAEGGALLVHGRAIDLRHLSDAFLPLRSPAAPGVSWQRQDAAVAPGPVLFWALTGLTFAALLVPGTWIALAAARWMAPADRFVGQATAGQVRRLAGATAVRRQAARLRPALDARRAPTTEVAIRVGSLARDGSPVWMGVGNNLGLVAGPQTGKTTSTMGVIPLHWPGPAVLTETHRPDLLAMSACQPDFDRPILILDPENRVRWPDPTGVNILDGCDDHAVAHRRANLLIRAATPRSESSTANVEFFIGEATTAATAFLHAARIGGLGLDAVLGWTQRWGSEQPVEILEAERGSTEAQSDAQMLRQLYAVAGPQAAGTAGELRNAFACLADPNVVRTFGGGQAQSLSIARLFDERGRLYVHGSGREQRSIAPFVAVVITEIVEEALTRAATAPGRRLDPPLLLDLDEIANIAPLPDLPYYLSAGAGSGVCTAWAAQGRSQLRKRWGLDAAREIWQATNWRVWWGGSVEAEELRELQDLSGEVCEATLTRQRPDVLELLMSSSQTRERFGSQVGVQRVPVFTAERLRTLPDGHAVLMARNLPVTELVMRPWWECRDIAPLVRESMRRFAATVATAEP